MPHLTTPDYEALRPLAQALAGMTTKATPNAVYLNGPGGIFDMCGLDNQVISALSLPLDGLANQLPARTSDIDNPLYALLTDISAVTGNEPNGVCEPGKQVGNFATCTTSAQFGRLQRESPIFDVDRFGLFRRGQTRDLTLVGGMNAPTMVNPVGVVNPQQALRDDVNLAQYLIGLDYQQTLGKLAYTGNPANSTAGGGYVEFKGLDLLINTGYTDVLTGTACPAANSRVVNFNADVATNVQTTYAQFVNMIRYLDRRATLAGLKPLESAIAMRSELFYALTEVWPCAYATYRCTNVFDTANVRVIDADSMNTMRQQMRDGNYLLVDGKQYTVILDDSIPHVEPVSPATAFSSTVYFVPLTVLGRINTTYWEFQNYSDQLARMNAGTPYYYVTDSGRFLWTKEKDRFCMNLVSKTQPRLVLRTPHLAGRLDNVRYSPTVTMPSPNRGEVGYVGGGVQGR